jgi:hypothetical protein
MTAAFVGAVVAVSLPLGRGASTWTYWFVLLLIYSVLPAVLTVLAYAVVGCLGAAHLDRSRIARPGQATRRGARDALATGLFAALVFAVVVGAGWAVTAALLSSGRRLTFETLLFAVPLVAVPVFAHWFLRAGGRGLLQQLVLRLLLRREGALSWRAVEFLEEMTRLGLMRRAGSGYLFPHRLLMEHFAALPVTPTSVHGAGQLPDALQEARR